MEQIRQFLRGRGLYAVLTACIAAAVAFSFFGVKNILQQENMTNQEGTQQWDLPGQPVEQKAPDVPVTTPTATTKPNASPQPAESSPSAGGAGAATEQPAVQELPADAPLPSFVWPVDGQIGQAFSGDQLVYNETLRDWRTHNGLDLKAQAGAPVYSAKAGTVKAVYEDVLWGQVVEVESDSMVWRYCGLEADSVSVQPGDSVEQGQTLGALGVIPAEQTECHLHLELLQDGVYQDPAIQLAD